MYIQKSKVSYTTSYIVEKTTLYYKHICYITCYIYLYITKQWQ